MSYEVFIKWPMSITSSYDDEDLVWRDLWRICKLCWVETMALQAFTVDLFLSSSQR